MFWIWTTVILVALGLIGSFVAENAEEIEELVEEAKYMWNQRKA